ncbi:MAG: Maf family protein, partial [Pseudolabrys sp.]|nr:Maf family protein [Pseudolabrys sp.]
MPLWLSPEPLVLASQSAARAKILAGAGIPIEIIPSDVDERAEESRAGVTMVNEAARLLARAKARAVSARMPGRVVLGADQTLMLKDRRFTKPVDRKSARDQLHALSGKEHRLYSAVAVVRDGD